MTRNDMMKIAVPAVAFAWLVTSGTAQANFDACGGIFVAGDAKCEYREKEECMTQCTSETVQTACAAKLYVSCEHECTESASTTCETNCSNGCTTTCTEQAPTKEPPNCMGLCVPDCKKTCARQGPHGACCSHNCNKRCEEKCKDDERPVAMPAQCTQTCSNACSGSCTAQANITCQDSCQTEVYTECETATIETCETKCMDEGGAIFCDGQFVNAKNSHSCADEIKDKLEIDIDFHEIGDDIADVADDAVDGTKDAYHATKKKSKALCSVARIGGDDPGSASAALLALSGLTLIVRRRRMA
jgi:hypothetical protein